jgi:cerevisin
VAKKAKLIAVKVLSDEGSGTIDDIIAALDWVVKQAESTGRRSVGSMSLGGSPVQSLDDAVRNTIAAGIPIAVAAGNESLDASTSSPARVKEAITVAASDIQNKHAYFSNYGPLVDIYAPGVDVTSTWIGSNDATAVLSGTSMATPHIAGLCAYILSIKSDLTPAEVQDKIKAMGTSGVSGVPPFTGTTKLLAYNGGHDGITTGDGSSSGSNVVSDIIAGVDSTVGNTMSNGIGAVVGKLGTLVARQDDADEDDSECDEE